MSSSSKKHAGESTALDTIIIVVMAALIVLAGLWVYQRSQDEKQEPAEDMTSQTQVEEEAAPAVEETEDLGAAEQYLEDLNIDDELNTKELDDTLN